mmetsp:Transcript_20393/g.18531  ORF Transcript_20393/g.18531 Transcript_20393/m.18531 type:complete len:151 (-) Transcript_20393:143-595(-)
MSINRDDDSNHRYDKIVIGEDIDEQNSPLIAHATPVQAEPYPQPAVEVADERYYHYSSRSNVIQGPYYETPGLDYKEPGEDCAFIGCLFSWIPIVGFITCCLNADAPPMSKREYWAHRACMVASLILLFNLVFWASYQSTNDDGCINNRC